MIFFFGVDADLLSGSLILEGFRRWNFEIVFGFHMSKMLTYIEVRQKQGDKILRFFAHPDVSRMGAKNLKILSPATIDPDRRSASTPQKKIIVPWPPNTDLTVTTYYHRQRKRTYTHRIIIY